MQYLVIMIQLNENGSFRISQPFAIDYIINFIHGMAGTWSAKSLMCSSIILTKDKDDKPRKQHIHYYSVICILNYLVNCTHPKTTCAINQSV